MNKDNVKKRSGIVKAIRRFFDERGYTEVQTPRLVGLPGQEPHLEPFWTEVKEQGGQSHSAALITSPEYAMKKLLAEGFEKIYDLGPCFRNNEPWDGTHDPEFFLLEWYRKEGDLSSLQDETEEMIKEVSGKFPEPFRHMTVSEAWKKYLHVELESLLENRNAIQRLAESLGQKVDESDSWDDIYFKIFLSNIESHLGEEPTFLYRYPKSQAALAKLSDDPRFAERVELYIGPYELANGFHELTDTAEQRTRFLDEQDQRRRLGKRTWDLDEALLSLLPNIGHAVGMAFGVDRLVMLLTGAKFINDVLPFSARERFGL